MRKILLFLMLPIYLSSSGLDKESLDKNQSIQSIFTYAKSERLKYISLLKDKNPHDIELIFRGKISAYEDMMIFMSDFSFLD